MNQIFRESLKLVWPDRLFAVRKSDIRTVKSIVVLEGN